MGESSLATTLGQVLRQVREDSGISQEHLAADCGLDRTYISLIERGQRNPTLKTVFALCEALEIAPSKLIRKIERKLDE